jgi:hypothetical protein
MGPYRRVHCLNSVCVICQGGRELAAAMLLLHTVLLRNLAYVASRALSASELHQACIVVLRRCRIRRCLQTLLRSSKEGVERVCIRCLWCVGALLGGLGVSQCCFTTLRLCFALLAGFRWLAPHLLYHHGCAARTNSQTLHSVVHVYHKRKQRSGMSGL